MPALPIGFDRKLSANWLDAAAGLAARRLATAETRRRLWDMLEGSVAGDRVNSARGKTVTVLMHTWITVPPGAGALRDRAADLFDTVPAAERLALHWAMLTATYPFFSDVASHVGRLLSLQGEVQMAQVERRIVTSWGDRSTIPRAVQRILRSMADWGALTDTPVRGSFTRPARPLPAGAETASVLADAVAMMRDEAGIGSDNGLFAFGRSH